MLGKRGRWKTKDEKAPTVGKEGKVGDGQVKKSGFPRKKQKKKTRKSGQEMERYSNSERRSKGNLKKRVEKKIPMWKQPPDVGKERKTPAKGSPQEGSPPPRKPVR